MTYHAQLTAQRWASLTMETRLLHIGAELRRVRHWLEVRDRREAEQCLERALELLDLSVATAKPGSQRREFCRVREVIRGMLFSAEPLQDAIALKQVLVGDA